jgi:hypothetical protein
MVSQVPPSLVQRWLQSRPTKRLLFWACAWTMVTTVLVGFSWGGWITRDKARDDAEGIASEAVTKRLALICVVRFKTDPDRTRKLKELNDALGNYDRTDYVQKQGWATMPGEDRPDARVAEECAKLLVEIS